MVAAAQEDDVLHASLLPLTTVIPDSRDATGPLVEPALATPAPLFQALGMPAAESTDSPEAAPVEATAQPTVAPPPPVYVIYTVKEGDTIGGIAAQYGVASTSVIWSNPGLESADSLAVGNLLRVPMSDGIVYDIQLGDTLSDIASRFGVGVEAITGFTGNNLASADSIAPSETIFIPGGIVAAPVATATPTPEPTEAPTPEATRAPQPVPSPDDGQPSDIGARALELAQSRIGSPYVSGAAGPDAFDCSGLVYWVYSQLGISIGRSAPQQYASTQHVDSSDLEPGDVVFFQNTFPSSDRITHVGIYAGGGGVIMAVDNGDVVREVSLSEAYWSEHFAGAGRP